jgi:hypothetical protein
MYILLKRLRAFFGKLRALFSRPRVKPEPPPKSSEGQPREANAASPYSDQYETIIRQGHTRPTPEFGAPTLVWHVGIWPRRYVKSSQEPCDPHDTFNLSYAKARREYDHRRRLWISQLDKLVKMLQEVGCGAVMREFRPYVPHELKILQTANAGRTTADASGEPTDASDEPTEVLQNETIGFTMWWGEGQERQDDQNAIRIRTQVELNADYATFSFYMDLGQYWNQPRQIDRSTNLGKRRSDAFKAVADVIRISEAQLKPDSNGVAPVDWPTVPERVVDGRNAQELDQALMDARNFLYVDLWEDFCDHFKCPLDVIAGDRGEVFANFRGLVLATEGMRGGSIVKASWATQAIHGLIGSLGTQTFPTFDPNGAEPNAVLKAFWPFLRRVTPGADYRDFTACGVMDWRALYITALGSSSQYDLNAEREPAISDKDEKDIIAHVRRDNGASQEDTQIRPRVGRDGKNHPVRYLFLTKCDPHPRQIGRIVERINTMGTLRLFALKDWAAIKDADPFIRMLGQELDDTIRNWSVKRRTIDNWKSIPEIKQAKERAQDPKKAADEFEELATLDIPGGFWPLLGTFGRSILALLTGKPHSEFLRKERRNRLLDVKYEASYEVTKSIETSLINISARLDHIGAKCVGGLHFRLYRANYYVTEFHILLDTLRVGNIPTWVAYDQFVKRGLSPAFDYISSVGTRLRALRDRLQSVTDTIETSALVVQSEATRRNTAVLRQIVVWAVIIVIGLVFRFMLIALPSISVGALFLGLWDKIRSIIGL